ncbi:Uncharacterized protein APZ42_007081 [Daphnia magna]|uniref:Uncharacterized protein n=1 Tax=Daphnia magna TaxID=35525 RepID=A0A164FIP7_9CRUS|nr:Uncharacterized protein APZ42_007081 [Daphnia magna]
MSSEDAEDLLQDSVIELFDLSDYSSTLPNNAKERYVAKLKCHGMMNLCLSKDIIICKF